MQSVSALAIDWQIPRLADEEWEFFQHPAKQSFYEKHGITWEAVTGAFDSGELTPYPRSADLCGITVQLAYHSYDDYKRYLAKARRGYRLSYNKMEEDLQRRQQLTLPAAIVLRSGDEALLFSGYRRLCLAWNYAMTPYVWQVNLDHSNR